MVTELLAELRHHLEQRDEPLPAALTGRASAVHITSRWEGRAVYGIFSGRERFPSLVIKSDANPEYQPRLRAEHEALCVYSRRPALTSGMPHPVALFPSGNALVLAQSGIAGVPLSVILRRRLRSTPRKTAHDHTMISRWLARLHATSDAQGSTPFDAERALNSMAANLPGELAVWRPFLQHMTAEAHRFTDLRIPLLPGHGDLAPSNCLINGSSVGVIDWEGGVEQRGPLAEIVVFLNHYARALPKRHHQIPDPEEAFRGAFVDDTWLARVTTRTLRAELDRLRLPAEAGQLLLASTLAELASGEADTAHGRRIGSRRNWSRLLASYAANYSTAPLYRDRQR